ncbi:hypothetical protein SISNIDRAFT_454481 [Sistotremastrum niveocremeum HHB9708]|uniref:Uncharacterized protein n=2 Tax=Sistotremastraceae TaxID=3402574 RepID=A0A164UKR2_9AGAM|nr:hypothetical protein SISNIDRAFT_454481 [Sistotremastrum niveocremeum HHB9708]KZT43875.1 hypothetical protein SISSUDRAFT_1039786 [Sistotremastrum suecicum HHB10207 ss-3]
MDNEAPEISTLREEVTPPPAPPAVQSKFRIKLPGRPAPPPEADALPPPPDSRHLQTPTTSRYPSEDEPMHEEEEDEIEEDQLIDDDDDFGSPNKHLSARSTPSVSPSKKATKGRGKKSQNAKLPDPSSMMSTFEVAPKDPQPVRTTEESWVPVQTFIPPTVPVPVAKPARKKLAPKKAGTTTKARKSKLSQVASASHLDEIGSVSEAVPGTTASSPMHPDLDAADYEPVHASHSIASPYPPLEEASYDPGLEPVPLWPPPTKSFSVQPPVKIQTAYAPALPLEKNTPKPRAWKIANREIRGIGGGRWFVRAWVGDKDSDYAAAAALNPKPAVAATSSSGTTGRKYKFLKPDTTTERSTPVIPDVNIVLPPAEQTSSFQVSLEGTPVNGVEDVEMAAVTA